MTERRSLDTSTYMVASIMESCLVICGGSASCGRTLSTRATRSRTSLAAPSMSRSRPNSIVMVERSSWLREVISTTPGRPATWSSMTWVMRRSTMSPDAPV